MPLYWDKGSKEADWKIGTTKPVILGYLFPMGSTTRSHGKAPDHGHTWTRPKTETLK